MGSHTVAYLVRLALLCVIGPSRPRHATTFSFKRGKAHCGKRQRDNKKTRKRESLDPGVFLCFFLGSCCQIVNIHKHTLKSLLQRWLSYEYVDAVLNEYHVPAIVYTLVVCL